MRRNFSIIAYFIDLRAAILLPHPLLMRRLDTSGDTAIRNRYATIATLHTIPLALLLH
jgi:hypothetical protein